MSAALPPEVTAGEPVVTAPSGGTGVATAELAVVVVDELVVEAADKLLVELMVGAVVGGELNPRTEVVCATALTAAATYVAGISQSPSSRNRRVGPFVPSSVAVGQFS